MAGEKRTMQGVLMNIHQFVHAAQLTAKCSKKVIPMNG
jgi:hypothetical protein